jgi:hypothetical protein
VKRYYETISIVFIHKDRLFGSAEKLGIYATVVKYQKDGIEYEETLENEEFSVMNEIVFDHIEESD